MPPIDGIDGYSGKIMHTARWDRSYDYRGKRVAVAGTGATALQTLNSSSPMPVEQLTVADRNLGRSKP